MIKVQYNVDKKTLNAAYLKLFEAAIQEKQKKWKNIRKQLNPYVTSLPLKIKNIMVADFKVLTPIYLEYTAMMNANRLTDTQKKDIKQKLEELFDYTFWQPKLSSFFMNSQNGFETHTCHYCDIAYINVYGFGVMYSNILDFLNNAPLEDLTHFLDIAQSTAQKIIDYRGKHLFSNVDEFDNMKCWKAHKKKSDRLLDNAKNHFDLDHVLDKGSCPIVALSLYNFTPSCQVCNEKLKRTQNIGTTDAELRKLSPTSPDYDFDNNVTITVLPKKLTCSTFGFETHKDDYGIEFKCTDADYQKTIDLFRLRERYNYHKVEALRLLDLKERYSDANIRSISRLLQNGTQSVIALQYTEQQIHEDIFGEDFSEKYHRCLGKLRKDILK